MVKTKIEMPLSPSETASTRNLGDKRCVRFSVSIQNEYDGKLERLAISCGIPKATLADALLRIALDSPPTIEWLQKKYNKNERYLVRPVVIDKKVCY